MVNLTCEELSRIMNYKKNIRNISLLNVDGVKLDVNVWQWLLLNNSVTIYYPDEETLQTTGLDICKRCITVEPLLHTIYFNIEEKQLQSISDNDQKEKTRNDFLVHILTLDSETDLSSALPLCDGMIMVVDCFNDTDVIQHDALKHTVEQRVKPLFFLDDLNYAMFERNMDHQQIYDALECINSTISSNLNELKARPVSDTVIFGSVQHGWAFNLMHFSKLYAEKFKIDTVKLTDRLWGDNFFNAKTKNWEFSSSEHNERTFCLFVLDPIQKLHDVIMHYSYDEVVKCIDKIDVTVQGIDNLLENRNALFQTVMQNWLPAHKTLHHMIVVHLPSPVVAQKYRTDIFYEGSPNDEAAIAIKNCDSEAPLMMFISRMVCSNGDGKYAFGRVFSGRVTKGMRASIVQPSHKRGSGELVPERKIKGIGLMMGRYVEAIEDVPSGNICGLVGVDQFLVKTGTITTFKDAHQMKVTKTHLQS